MNKLVKELCEGIVETSVYWDVYGDTNCPFCEEGPGLGREMDKMKHEKGCLYLKAKKILTEVDDEKG